MLTPAGGAFQAFVRRAGGMDVAIFSDPWLWSVARFSLIQASLSAFLSVAIGLRVALALARRRFAGRQSMPAFLVLGFVLPQLLVVFGIISVWGNSGWANSVLSWLGAPRIPPAALYGLPGILLGHVFFNIPFASLIFWQQIERIRPEYWHIARTLGFGRRECWKHCEWPAVRNLVLPVGGIIFLLCLSSFAIVLILGGSTLKTTLEVAIYYALRFNYEPQTAIALASLQWGIILVVLLAILRSFPSDYATLHFFSAAKRPDQHEFFSKLIDGVFLFLLGIVFFLPLAAILARAAQASWSTVFVMRSFRLALVNSVMTGVCSAFLSVILAICLVLLARAAFFQARAPRLARFVSAGGFASFIMPPALLASGLFLWLFPLTNSRFVALSCVIMVNSLAILPILVHQIQAPAFSASRQYGRLAQTLGIRGWSAWRLIDWPLMRRAAIIAAAIAFCLSFGDLTAIAFFGDSRITTLPWLMAQWMGSYRFQSAAAIAGVMIAFFALAGILASALAQGESLRNRKSLARSFAPASLRQHT